MYFGSFSLQLWMEMAHFAPNEPFQALLTRPHPGKQVVTAVYPNFLIDIMQMGLDGCQRDEQLAGDIGITLALDHFQDNLPLAVGDAVSGKKGFRQGVCRERSEWGSDGVAQEVDDQEDPVQGIWDGAV